MIRVFTERYLQADYTTGFLKTRLFLKNKVILIA